MNQFTFIGNATRDPELTTTPGGKSVCKLTIAVNRTYKQEGQPDVDFFNLTIWGKVGENVGKYVRKGKKVMVQGRIQNRTYDKDGDKKYITDYIAENVEFLSPAGTDSSAPPPEPPLDPRDDPNHPHYMKPVSDDSLPF